MKQEIIDKIKGLKIKGYSNDDILKILNKFKVKKEEVEKVEISEDITENSVELYTGMQKDLSTLISKELRNEKSDSNVILNSIKLQAELQEKKLVLNRKVTPTKISKEYIYERDEEIYVASKTMKIDKIAKMYDMSEWSIRQAIDRRELGLSEELQTLSPTIISETFGLNKQVRLGILDSAYKNNLKRKDVREIVNKIKNKVRK